MNPSARSVSIFVLMLSFLGAAALFLPFTSEVSPWDVVRGAPDLDEYILFAAPLFLVIPTVAWELRKLVARRLKSGEIAAAYVLAVAAMLPVFDSAIFVVQGAGLDEIAVVLAIAVSMALAVENVLLLMRNRRAGQLREATAEAFLLGGYLPNATLCLILWYPRGLFSGWDPGAYIVAVVCVGYVTAIVLLSRKQPAGTSDTQSASEH